MGFFSKKDKKSTADSSDNPYAQQPPAGHISQPPPMATQERARAGLPSGPRPGGGGLPGGPSPRVNAGYGGSPAPRQSEQSSGGSYGTPNAPPNAGGYGNDRPGYSGGYGGNRYNNSGGIGQGPSRSTGPGQRGPGGYGGMGGPNRSGDQDGPDVARDELFGAKPQSAPPDQNRYRQPAPAAYNRAAQNDSDVNRGALFAGAQDRQPAGADGMYGGGQSGVEGGSYGGYGEERELTEEEKEEMRLQNVRDETKRVRQAGIESLDRSINLARNAVETSTATMARLGYQEDMLDNTQKSFTNAKFKSEEAHTNARDLYRINGSMFSGVGGAFNKGKRHKKEDEEKERLKQAADGERASNRAEYYASQQHSARAIQEIHDIQPQYAEDADDAAMTARIKKQNSKYLFSEDADDEDVQQEAEIDRRLREMSGLASQLHTGGRVMGVQVDRQNKKIDKLAQSGDLVGDGIQKNRAMLNRIK